jgi:hypothetical protein
MSGLEVLGVMMLAVAISGAVNTASDSEMSNLTCVICSYTFEKSHTHEELDVEPQNTEAYKDPAATIKGHEND